MDRDAMAQAAYEARHIGHFVTPWDDLPSDRRWFWYAVVDAVLREYVGQLQYTMPRDRVEARIRELAGMEAS